ncbi:hypothetical protein HQ520_05450 [bacterium]|nr:hypothetical protein [bacterium]
MLRQSPADDPGRAGRFRAVAAVIGIGLFLFPVLWKPWIHGNDGVRHYSYCRSLVLDRDLDFSNEFRRYFEEGELEQIRIDPATGLPGNTQGIGSGLLWMPFFLAGHLIALVSRFPADGYSAPYVWTVCLGTSLYALAGLILLTSLAAWRFGAGSGLFGVLSVWLGSPLVFYMYLHPSMSHGCSFFLVALLVWECARWREKRSRLRGVVMGLTVGLAAATRINNAVFLLIPAAVWLEGAVQGRRGGIGRSVVFAGLIGSGVILGFLPQMVAWKVFHGSWFSGPRQYDLGGNITLLASSHFFELLFSGWRGLFVWSPVLIPATIGLVFLAGRRDVLAITLTIAFAAQLWVIGGWAFWHGSASFGQRFFINFVPAFALGSGYLFSRLRRGWPRRAFLGLVGFCLLWTAGLAVQYVSRMIDREECVTLRTLVVNQATRVPAWTIRHLRLLRPGNRIDAGRDGEQ